MDLNYKIPKVCPCGYAYNDSLSKNHMYSNQHNFGLLEQRKAARQTTEKSTKGDCESCGVKNIRNLERHFLTNSHIVKHDIFTTRKYIEDTYKKFKEDEALKNRAVNAERQEDDGGV